jgi:DNA-directed RNA polymerase delta subunit
MQILKLEDYTYKRLSSVLEEVMHNKRKNLNFDDLLNELIDVYQESVWGSIGGQIGGG